jgi:hypothetical protein
LNTALGLLVEEPPEASVTYTVQSVEAPASLDATPKAARQTMIEIQETFVFMLSSLVGFFVFSLSRPAPPPARI